MPEGRVESRVCAAREKHVSAIDAWVFVAAVFGVLWVFWALLMFTLTHLELARRRTVRVEPVAEADER